MTQDTGIPAEPAAARLGLGPARIEVDATARPLQVRITGALILPHVGAAERQLAALPCDHGVVVDAAGLAALDTAGAWALAQLAHRAEAAGLDARITGLAPRWAALLADIRRAMPKPLPPPRPPTVADRLEALGRSVAGLGRLVIDLVAYLGLFVGHLAGALARPGRFPLTSLAHHCHQVGVNAVPIVALMAFLIGIVVAFQGATQLRQFGAEVFVVDLIAISVLRELGILLTAVIVAGRTASAYTAAIGAMKMREEIDAMRTLSIDPARVLVLPRVLALVMMLPVLGLIANLAGLIGGALMSWAELGISPAMFRTRLIEETSIDHVLVGMIKAPVFALLIGLIGCHAGMQVRGDTESLGRMTSAAVVRALFAVILADALFSVFFAKIGI